MIDESKNQLRLRVRWMIRRDIPEVLAIERERFEFPWFEEDFSLCLRQRNCTGIVAEVGDRVVGFAVYELNRLQLRILNFAVSSEFRKQGVGRQMVNWLSDGPHCHRIKTIVLDVRETNLGGQLFFRSMGFRAIAVVVDYYNDSAEDCYAMEYECRVNAP